MRGRSSDTTTRQPQSPPSAGKRTGPAHPRIRARQVAVARDVGRQRRRRLNVALAVVALVVWGLVGVHSSLLDVDRVQVDGAEETSPEAVRAAVGIGPGVPMTGIDLDGAARAAEQLPWLDEVRVQRMWPGTVRIVVTERRALAAVRAETGWVLLDADGRALAATGDQPELPELVVLEGRRDVAPGDDLGADDQTLLGAVAQLPDALRSEVVGVDGDARGLRLDLRDGWSAVLGDGDDLVAKSEAVAAVRRAADPADGCTIDVRVPSAPVLTPGGRCA